MSKRGKAKAKKRRKNGAGGLAFLVNPGGMFSKKRKKRRSRKRRNAPMARKRRKSRKRHNPFVMNAKKHRKHGRRRKHNARRRHHARRRRNPGLGGMMAGLKSHLSQLPGGAAAGLLDLFVGDRLLSGIENRQIRAGVKIASGPVLAAVAGRFAPSLSKHAASFVGGMAALGTKDLVGQMTGSPQSKLQDLAEQYGELISADMQGLGLLESGTQKEINDLGLVDYMVEAEPVVE